MSNISRYNDLEIKILELYASGKSKDTIAIELKLPKAEVNRVFSLPKVREKIAEIIEQRELLMREKHLSILEDITDKMLERADGDIGKLLNKGRDILDVIDLTSKVNKETEKKRLGTSEGNVLVQILQNLGGDDG